VDDKYFWARVKVILKSLPRVRRIAMDNEGVKIYYKGGIVVVNWDEECEKSRKMKGNWWKPEVGDKIMALILEADVGDDMHVKVADLITETEYILPRHEYLRKALRGVKRGDIYYIELLEKNKDRRMGVETYKYHVVERNDLRADPDVKRKVADFLAEPPF